MIARGFLWQLIAHSVQSFVDLTTVMMLFNAHVCCKFPRTVMQPVVHPSRQRSSKHLYPSRSFFVYVLFFVYLITRSRLNPYSFSLLCFYFFLFFISQSAQIGKLFWFFIICKSLPRMWTYPIFIFTLTESKIIFSTYLPELDLGLYIIYRTTLRFKFSVRRFRNNQGSYQY